MPVYNPVTGLEPFHSSVVYPNPNQGNLMVEVSVKEEATIQIDIFNLVGSEVASHGVAALSGKTNLTMDLTGLSKGIYFCRITVNGTTQTHRFVIIP
ncbi:MAG: T9SS type A sorting domain-containing protein [Cyclobacteriaceae bacterium]|nr:T9SS type A sorting domain-containing protein [Cyclobacteriaceae bacterium]